MVNIEPKVAFSDYRGKLIEVVKSGVWKQMNHLFTTGGNVRGNHYHKKLRELFYVLNGKMKIELLDVKTNSKELILLNAGQCYTVEPYQLHIMTALEDTDIISLYSEVFDEQNPDLYKLDGTQQK